MKNTNEEQNAPQEDWQNAERAMLSPDPKDRKVEDDDDDDNETEEEENEDDERGDWGHTDPQDSPFPDSNDPTSPGSAV